MNLVFDDEFDLWHHPWTTDDLESYEGQANSIVESTLEYSRHCRNLLHKNISDCQRTDFPPFRARDQLSRRGFRLQLPCKVESNVHIPFCFSRSDSYLIISDNRGFAEEREEEEDSGRGRGNVGRRTQEGERCQASRAAVQG